MIPLTYNLTRSNLLLRCSVSLATILAAFFITGCESSGIPNRIQEKSVIFNTLPPVQQQDIKNGYFGEGYTMDMVYIAVGKASKITTNGQDILWTFNNFYPAYGSQSPQTTLDYALTAGRSGPSDYVSANAPSSGGGATKGLGDTSTRGGVQTSATIPDLPSDTLFILFREGRVIKHWLASDVR